MNRLFLVSLATTAAALAVACTVSQDLGGGSGSVGGQNGDSGTTTADSGQGTSSGSVDSGTSSGNVDSGTSSGNVDSGKDASSLAPCPAVAGYPAAPFLKYTFTGGRFTAVNNGVRDTSTMLAGPQKPSVRAGHFTSTIQPHADYTNHFLVYANQPSQEVNGQFVGPSWSFAMLTEETGFYLKTGESYSFQVDAGSQSTGSGNGQLGDSMTFDTQTVQQNQAQRYPGQGPGSCTMIVDFAQGGPNMRVCLNARFSCTGLVGKNSGETFDIVDGKLSTSSGL